MHYSMIKPPGSNFRVITSVVFGVGIFRMFTVHGFLTRSPSGGQKHLATAVRNQVISNRSESLLPLTNMVTLFVLIIIL